MTLRDLDRSYKDSALNILCAAFHDYPVMRYVIGEADPEYDGKLRQLIGFFVEARLLVEVIARLRGRGAVQNNQCAG